ncbi:uncharacterized protein N7469_001371 [Penicillium citrinum]|uniref:Zn(2)-C6 fungal-type domain-containing protein n=1 Tax=Penicillium citrinum TaxID=5077 RepID=A0A9W9PGS6_PENCI|nr:uncharacterized protein N7469_001371 [Penicillium citrinum]KAJ5243044.1 hypothetical protein N7469_001371 [Penicillium citrinum]
MHSRRRNGRLASCETCRKDKVKCDHAQPTCERCHKRGLDDRCFYHPAPLTSASTRRPNRQREIRGSFSPSLRNLHSPGSNPGTLDVAADRSSVIRPEIRANNQLTAGYLGPTSFVAGFEGVLDVFFQDVEQFNANGCENPAMATPPVLVKRTADVLRCLQEFTTIKNLVRGYYSISQTAVIPSPFILNALDELEIVIDGGMFERSSDEQLMTFGTFVLQNTGKSFKIPQESDGSSFHKSFSGSSLRLEIIGVICALAGRANYFGLAGSIARHIDSRINFPRKMSVLCDIVIQICKSLTGLNDLTLWLVHESLMLSKLLDGDSSSITWNRLGELATDIFELGAHRDISSTSSISLPSFILETRRRLFAASYHFDKSVATFLGRPPRISWRHSDCPLPLDISDEALAGQPHVLDAAQRTLDADGWSTKNTYQQASWIRMRFIISTFREEILELSLQKPSPNRKDQLRDVSSRCHRAWSSLPKRLRYTPSCWKSDLPIGVKLMSVISYLAYLYNDFSIQRILHHDPEVSDTSLLDVSSEILSTVLTLGRQWERSVDIKGDYTWIVLVYGFSCASVLVRALQRQSQTGQPLLYSGSRASLLRNLSVFISHLESMDGAGQANSSLFTRAISVLSAIVDEILEPRPEAPIENSSLDTALEFNTDAPFLFDLQGIDLIDTENFRIAFDDML